MTVNEPEGETSFSIDSVFETDIERESFNSGFVDLKFSQELDSSGESLAGDIIVPGKVFLDQDSGVEGQLIDDGNENLTANVNVFTAPKLELLPWGNSFVGTTTESSNSYIVDDGAANDCSEVIGLMPADLESQSAYDNALQHLSDEGDLVQTIIDNCALNVTGASVFSMVMSKKPTDLLIEEDLSGDWGLVGIKHEFDDSGDFNAEIDAYAGKFSVDSQGNTTEYPTGIEFEAYYGSETREIYVEVDYSSTLEIRELVVSSNGLGTLDVDR